MKRKAKILLILLIIINYLSAQNVKRENVATRTLHPPKIDGVLDDVVWENANIATGMLQLNPFEGKKATYETEVKILYDNNAIYIYALLYDSAPDSIRKELGSRDDQSINADIFYIGFDTYNRLDACVFGVSASGVQQDYKDSDPTFDAVWESSVKINEKGWAAEMRIPYSALRFPSVTEQEWGFQFTRLIKRTGEYNQWALTPKTASNSRLFWGKIKGFSNIKAPLRLSLNPFASAYYEKAPVYSINQPAIYNTSTSYNIGADLKYGLNEKFTLDVTLLPDFSQVQSDNKVKNLSYMEVTYNENRFFFKEGTELFNKNNLFYSRRIGSTPLGFYILPYTLNPGEKIIENPSSTHLLNAIKLSGRNNNGLGMGLFNAITDNTYSIIEDYLGNKRKTLTNPLTNYNVVVFDQQLKNTSSFYIINTNVIRNHKDFDNANVTGAGFSIKNKKTTFAVDGDIAISQKLYKQSSNIYQDIFGHQYFVGARKISGNILFGLSHTFINKTYNSQDIGYYIIGNKMKEKIYLSYNIYKPNKIFRESYNTFSFNYGINPQTKKPYLGEARLDFSTTLLDYSTVIGGVIASTFLTYDYNEPRIEGRFSRNFRYYYLYGGYYSDSRKPIDYFLYSEFGDFLENFGGKAFKIYPGINYRFNYKFKVGYSFSYNIDSYNIGFVNVLPDNEIIYGGRKLTTYENNASIQYMFKNDMSLNITCRHYWNKGVYKKYFELLTNGEIEENPYYLRIHDFNYNTFNIDLSYSWQFAPGSTISIMYKNAIESDNNLIIKNFIENLDKTLNCPQTNGLSFKLVYYLDYQYLKNRNKSKNA